MENEEKGAGNLQEQNETTPIYQKKYQRMTN